MVYTSCYGCGQEGHVRAECPRRTNARRTQPPPRPPADARPGKVDEIAVAPPRSSKAPDYAGQAQETRQAMGGTRFGSPAPVSPPGFLRREAERWSVRGELRSRATFGQPHPDDFPGGLPIPPECPTPASGGGPQPAPATPPAP